MMSSRRMARRVRRMRERRGRRVRVRVHAPKCGRQADGRPESMCMTTGGHLGYLPGYLGCHHGFLGHLKGWGEAAVRQPSRARSLFPPPLPRCALQNVSKRSPLPSPLSLSPPPPASSALPAPSGGRWSGPPGGPGPDPAPPAVGHPGEDRDWSRRHRALGTPSSDPFGSGVAEMWSLSWFARGLWLAFLRIAR